MRGSMMKKGGYSKKAGYSRKGPRATKLRAARKSAKMPMAGMKPGKGYA